MRNTFVRKVQVVETTSVQPAEIPYFRNSAGQKQGRLHRLDSGTLVRYPGERRGRSQAETRAEPFSPGRASLGAIATMAIFCGDHPGRSSWANFRSQPLGGMIFDGSTVENRFERR